MTYLAYQVAENDLGFSGSWQTLEDVCLPDNDVWVEVKYSSVNYKDMLSASGNRAVTKHYPHVPGIDAAGVVISSRSDYAQIGDEVLVFGYDLGMNSAGGFAQYCCVPEQWVIKKPAAMDLKTTMAWGTAGFTAALSVEKLLRYGITPENGAIAVTGASGGVGSVAVMLLKQLGFEVIAITGKVEQVDFLKKIGASAVFEREQILAYQHKALAKPIFQAAVDTVGGDMIAALLPQIFAQGAVTTCGMVAGTRFSSSVFPFILRGVALLGVDSVEIPLSEKQALLDNIATRWALPQIETLVTDIGRSALDKTLELLKQGQAVGRYRLCLEKP